MLLWRAGINYPLKHSLKSEQHVTFWGFFEFLKLEFYTEKSKYTSQAVVYLYLVLWTQHKKSLRLTNCVVSDVFAACFCFFLFYEKIGEYKWLANIYLIWLQMCSIL